MQALVIVFDTWTCGKERGQRKDALTNVFLLEHILFRIGRAEVAD
jgi:hypothetical protein